MKDHGGREKKIWAFADTGSCARRQIPLSEVTLSATDIPELTLMAKTLSRAGGEHRAH